MLYQVLFVFWNGLRILCPVHQAPSLSVPGSGFSALLRCPASASTLGRHSRLADRCAKNCSLYSPFCHLRDIFPRSGGSLCSQAAVAILALDRTCHEAFFKILLYKGVNDQHGGCCHDDGSKLDHFGQLIQFCKAARYHRGLAGAGGALDKDVAKEAGVSLGTVSKVLNGIPVGDEYRKKVEQAIKTLDYHINAYAKGLKNNRTYTVAVILPNLLNPFFSMVAHYINRALVNRGYRMLLCDTEYDYTKEREMVQMVAQNKVDGIIALTYNPDLKIPPDVRSVSIDRYLSGSTTCVASDNYNGGHLAAQKLVENGCKNLAFLRIGSPLTSETNKRRDGFVAECEAMQLPCTQKILMDDAPLSEFEHFLEENLKDGRLAFDGIFCVTDKLAVAVIKMLRRMGQRVPEDVQVIGYDGLRAFGDQDYYCPTIIQPVEAMAETCVELVLGEPNPNTPSLLCLPVRYAYGGTTKA